MHYVDRPVSLMQSRNKVRPYHFVLLALGDGRCTLKYLGHVDLLVVHLSGIHQQLSL